VKVAVVGGTGDFGLALAHQLVAAGHEVVIGSRDVERAHAKAAEVGARGATNEEAVRDVELVVLAVKAEAALHTAAYLADEISAPVLSVASELRFTKQGVYPGEEGLSLAEQTQELLQAPVVAGLHSLAAMSLTHGKAEGDALICGDDAAAKELALALAGELVTGRALDSGPLASARALEGMTAVIINLNKRYRAHAGVQITGLP
jgi:NADPH-dependent F420 reductase